MSLSSSSRVSTLILVSPVTTAPAFDNAVCSPEVAPKKTNRLVPRHPLTAIVLRWDHNRTTVICPFCSEAHIYLIRLSPATDSEGLAKKHTEGTPGYSIFRRALCWQDTNSSLSCKILFPFGQDERVSGLSWEIEMYNNQSGSRCRRFRTIGIVLDST
ncbi:hypothetical protein LZ31DRAFT_310242 [Colletotrichum somersetense]|nr:hypothetical protein LZ31DRAFT_310242 [Colletotrichum somersetense]